MIYKKGLFFFLSFLYVTTWYTAVTNMLKAMRNSIRAGEKETAPLTLKAKETEWPNVKAVININKLRHSCRGKASTSNETKRMWS